MVHSGDAFDERVIKFFDIDFFWNDDFSWFSDKTLGIIQ